MIYLDSTYIVKCYVNERGTPEVLAKRGVEVMSIAGYTERVNDSREERKRSSQHG